MQVNIVDLYKASVIYCRVTCNEKVEYEGDSSYEANVHYNRLVADGQKPSYYKDIKKPTKDQLNKVFNPDDADYIREVLARHPQRIQFIYASFLAGKPVEVDVLNLAKKFHPEYFPIVVNSDILNKQKKQNEK